MWTLRLAGVVAFAAVAVSACKDGPNDGSSTEVTDATGASDETNSTAVTTGAPSPPAGCPAYTFPEFEGPYGQVYCEVYIGCFGEAGGREPGDPKATTVEECIEQSCGNGNVDLQKEVDCSLDPMRAQACLEFMNAIAADLKNKCPGMDDAWFPEDCSLAIQCAIGD